MDKDWQESPLGRATIRAEAALLGEVLGDVYGLELLQIGAWGRGRELLERSRFRRPLLMARDASEVDTRALPRELPVASGTFDAVLLPHCLEVEPDPYAVLREADRVLGGEGQLLTLGYRPVGPWGWRAAASRRGFPPGLQRLIPEWRLREWLVLLGYEILAVHRYLYFLPTAERAVEDGLPPGAIRRGWFYPFPAGAYLLRARKRILGMTPIRPRARERRAVLGGALEPSA